jgi:hypothetical protein
MGDQNLLSRAPPCFGRHVKLLVSTVFAVVSTHSGFKEGWRQSLSQHDGKHVVPTPLSVIRVGKRKKNDIFLNTIPYRRNMDVSLEMK